MAWSTLFSAATGGGSGGGAKGGDTKSGSSTKQSGFTFGNFNTSGDTGEGAKDNKNLLIGVGAGSALVGGLALLVKALSKGK